MKGPLGLFVLELLACVSCDHATKHAAEQWLGGVERICSTGT